MEACGSRGSLPEKPSSNFCCRQFGSIEKWRMFSTVVEACGLRGAEPEKPSSAAPMEPMVTAMCSQDRKVRSLAKKVLGSMRCGMVADSRASACRVKI